MDMQRYEDVDVGNDIDEDYDREDEDQDSSIEETQNKSGSSKL